MVEKKRSDTVVTVAAASFQDEPPPLEQPGTDGGSSGATLGPCESLSITLDAE
jgi:hypothetical protein